MLLIKNKHALDARIKFQEEGHIYWIDNDTTDLISSTTYIKKFTHEFNADKVIEKMVRSYNYRKNFEYKYYQMPAEDIKDMWGKNRIQASQEGTKLHADIEDFYNDVKVKNTSVEYKYFLDFYEDHKHLKIYRTEWCIFSGILKLTGSIDGVFLNLDGTLSLYDWKRSKKISYNSYGGERMKYPFSHFQDCNFFHYSLQLNLYRKILETYYGKTITDLFIVVFHPDNEKYIKIKVKRMENELDSLFSCRAKDLLKLGYNDKQLKSLIDKDDDREYEFVIESDTEYDIEQGIQHKRLLPCRK